MKQLIINIYLQIKLKYYQFLDYLDDQLGRNVEIKQSDLPRVVKQKENAKLIRGVRRLVKSLRSMSSEDRLSTENLLCRDSYKKSRKEKIDEIRVRDRMNKNPMLKTENDLVNKVVKESPRYAKQQELKEVRKAMRSTLKAAQDEPNNPKHTEDMKALHTKFKLLLSEIERMKVSD